MSNPTWTRARIGKCNREATQTTFDSIPQMPFKVLISDIQEGDGTYWVTVFCNYEAFKHVCENQGYATILE